MVARLLLALLLALLGGVAVITEIAINGAQAQTLVIQGGTLIDGTGRAPIENSVIVIEGNRFRAVGRAGEVQIPPGAQTIDVRGKTVLPGFIDGHCHWESFWGEVYLHLGITTCVQIETQQNGPWGLAQKEGTEMGRIRGPRIWPTGQAIGAREGEFETEGSRAWRGHMKVASPQAARASVEEEKKDGQEALRVSELLEPGMRAVITDEAHKLGMGVTGHSWDVVGYANSGIDS